jgi:hypothetical protein
MDTQHMTIKRCNYSNLPFRDLVYRITFEDGREPAYISTYNDEITAWTDNAPDELKRYSSNFNIFLQQKLSSKGISFWFEGINETQSADVA